MSKASYTDDILNSGGFWLHKIIGKYLRVASFTKQTVILTVLSAGSMFLASIVDNSLYFPGRDVGFLEHPAMWGFLVLQTVLPISLARSLRKLEHTTIENGEIAYQSAKPSKLLLPSVREFLKLRHRGSRFAAATVYSIGVIAWGLNTIQNQFPSVIVPYDFWDSTTYIFGYAVTRFYKAYLFIVLIPYLALVHTAILVAALRLVRASRLSGELRLLPFHPDRVGGLNFVAGFISKPIIITLLVGAGTTAGAFLVHRAMDITPVAGLSILLGWALLTYLIPILILRTDIVAMKKELTTKIRQAQQLKYSKVLEGTPLEFRVLEEENEALEYFDRVCGKIESISSLPHWKRLLAFIGLAATPSLVTLVLKYAISLAPITDRLLGQP
jgi:hypothetical protein